MKKLRAFPASEELAELIDGSRRHPNQLRILAYMLNVGHPH
jgi:hypothetical protein